LALLDELFMNFDLFVGVAGLQPDFIPDMVFGVGPGV
jgi:hypothetical protein